MNASAPSQALGRVVVDELIRHGVQHACLSPGSRSAPLAIAFAERDEIELHVSLDERSTSFLALGIAKATRRPAAILCTSGTAAANFHPAIVEAHHSRIPLLVFTADRPPELRDTGASQTIDQIKMFGDDVRWFVEVGVPEDLPSSNSYWRSIVSRACAAAQGSPPGPVHLNVAFRDPLVPVDGGSFTADIEGRAGRRPWTAYDEGTPVLSEPELQDLAGEMRSAKRGVIVAGAGEVDPGPLHSLAETLGWPVLADPFSGARTPGAISTYDALLRDERFRNSVAPDLVLRVGAGLLSKPLASLVAGASVQILIDADGEFLDPNRSITRVVRADPASVCGALTGSIQDGPADPAYRSEWDSAEKAARAAIDEVLDEATEPNEPRTARDVTAALPDGATLVVASSMPLRDVEAFMAPRDGLRLLANRGANGIDGYVSTVLGVALASSGPVAGLCGDLSMLHDQNGLLLLRHEPVDVTFVVVNNDGGGIFSFLPQARLPEHYETLFGTPQSIDFSALASFYGFRYGLAATASDVPDLLHDSIERGGPAIIEVRTDREANVALHARLVEAVTR